MCGFVGFFAPNGAITQTQKNDAYEMSCAIAHRGPDLDLKYDAEHVCFAFRRLSIIDLEGGGQPFISEDGRFAAVYNGEIYNYLELRTTLSDAGVTFRTRSEIEVLVKLYEKYGTDCVAMLRGMFSFLLYDKQENTLLAARDPFGIKPLYYRKTADAFIFSSEMKAFLYDSSYDGFKVDKTLLQHYMTFQYVTEPDTMPGDIAILPKGSWMLCSKNACRTATYFTPVFHPDPITSYGEKKKKLREVIEKSVEYHMISDVPVGAFLSSGIDSAVVTAVASKLTPGIKAFTVGFDVPGYSELEDAKAISSHLAIDHILLQCNLKDFTDNYERVIYHLDSPLADPSVVAIYLISREAAKHVKVVLTGEGSDEIFGGYRQYATALSTARLSRLPGMVRSPLLGLAKILPEKVKGKHFLMRGLIPVEERFVGNSFVFAEEQKRGLLETYDSSVRFTDRTRAIYDAAPAEYSQLLKMQHCDLATWLPSDILVKGDRLSMANSLEARVPFLDKEVFAVASSFCDSDKLNQNTTKFILRDAFSDLLNAETVMRPKLGYPVPVRVWLKNELYDWAANIIRSNPCEQYINTAEALKLLELHHQGKADLYHQIWVILTFITWYKLYVCREGVKFLNKDSDKA